MTYNELHQKLKKAGCEKADGEIAGHPIWYSPKTDEYFGTSHHGSEEVKIGTLKEILRLAGVELPNARTPKKKTTDKYCQKRGKETKGKQTKSKRDTGK